METITMSHGSGGKSSDQLISHIFAKHFSNPILNKMEDAAVFEICGKVAYSTDSFVVDPIFFPGGNIGKLALCGTVNDLAMMGAIPKYVTAGFILEEGLPLDQLEELVMAMADAAREANVTIVAGDTKVVEGKGGLYINTSGIGLIPEDRNISPTHCAVGDAIIVSGNMGDHHGCILSQRMGIENGIKSDCTPLNNLVEKLFKGGIRVKAMRDITRGGLGTILNEMAHSSNNSIEIFDEKIPVHPEVAAFCDILGLDPIYMANEGKFVLFVHPDDEEKALNIMHGDKDGKEAKTIGSVKEGAGVYAITKLGGKRMIDLLFGEGLPRIC